ncbi:MAG: crotonobetainyl-CoA--carnitine CoA-transferase [Myxococcales bacterium]|nr:crotonobetainyl-CoA--carnitine CoA-transferase [Myxococcales bacterium]
MPQKVSIASTDENNAYQGLVRLFRECPLPDSEVLKDVSMFLNRPSLSHILFMGEIYKQIIDVHGCVFEFGVKWGRTMSLLTTLRHIYEPYNTGRRIIGFDTFTGFPSVSEQDGSHKAIQEGGLAVTPGYESYLEELLTYQEQLAPRSHIKKFELRKGDATVTFKEYLEEHPEALCALAYFDFDLYEPTKVCLELLKDRLTKGSIIVFDQLTWDVFPGETIAFQEVLGANNYRVRRSPLSHYSSYIVIE